MVSMGVQKIGKIGLMSFMKGPQELLQKTIILIKLFGRIIFGYNNSINYVHRE